MLNTNDLAWMRDDLEALLPDTCVILTPTTTSDGQGGYETTWGTASVNVKCRIDPGRKEMYEQISGAKLAPFSWWQLTLPWDATVTTESRVVVNGNTYNVVNHDDNKSWMGTLRVAVMKV
jgi:hypothetical protein